MSEKNEKPEQPREWKGRRPLAIFAATLALGAGGIAASGKSDDALRAVGIGDKIERTATYDGKTLKGFQSGDSVLFNGAEIERGYIRESWKALFKETESNPLFKESLEYGPGYSTVETIATIYPRLSKDGKLHNPRVSKSDANERAREVAQSISDARDQVFGNDDILVIQPIVSGFADSNQFLIQLAQEEQNDLVEKGDTSNSARLSDEHLIANGQRIIDEFITAKQSDDYSPPGTPAGNMRGALDLMYDQPQDTLQIHNLFQYGQNN